MEVYLSLMLFQITAMSVLALMIFAPFRQNLRFSLRTTAVLSATATVMIVGLTLLLRYMLRSVPLQRQVMILVMSLPVLALYWKLINTETGKKIFVMVFAITYLTSMDTWSFLIDQVIYYVTPLRVYQADWIMLITYVVLTLAGLPLVRWLMLKKLLPIWTSVRGKAWRQAWLLPLITTTFSFTGAILTNNIDINLSTIICLFAISMMPVLAYYFIFVMLKIVSAEEALMREVDEARNQLALQTNQYHRITERIEQTRKARHDLRHHMAALSALAKDGNLEAVQKYLAEYSKTLSNDLEQPICRNYAVDVIVRHYLNRARSDRIDTSVRLNLPEHMNIDDMDICIVFGNCIENAIEACAALPEHKRFIRINSLLSGNSLVITIENSYDTVSYNKDGELVTTKQGGGIGLSNVRTIAEKYNGHASFQPQDDCFASVVVLSLTPARSRARAAHIQP